MKALLTPSWERMFLRVPAKPENALDRRQRRRHGEADRQAPGRRLPRRLARRRPAGQWGVEILNADEEKVGALIRSEGTVLALSDAGAHVDTLCDQGFTSYLLGHWVRERGLLGLGEAGAPRDEPSGGGLRPATAARSPPAKAADVVLFDPKQIRMRPTEVVSDLPGGQVRLLQRAEGIPLVLVNGKRAVADGKPIGTPAGRCCAADGLTRQAGRSRLTSSATASTW